MRPVLVTIRTWVWNATLRRPASLVLSIVCLGIIWFLLIRVQQHVSPPLVEEDVDWEEAYEKLRLANLKEHASFYVGNKSAMEPVPLEWAVRSHCPACFGTEMCSAVERKEILVEIPKTPTPANKKGVYLGQWLDIPIAVKRLSNWYPKEFELFDQFICQNATGSTKCNVSAAIVQNNSYVQRDSTLTPESMIHAWKISYPEHGAEALTYALCITPRFIKRFSSLYDSNNDGSLSPDQKAMMFTSMVVQPESLMLKFLKEIQFQRIAPRVYGACGRLVVVEHGGQLLSTYLDEPFAERAELALQLLSLVQVFWHADRRWFALYKDFVFENVAVSHEKEIYIIDYEELSVIENADFDEANDEDRHEEHSYGHNMTCNDACFTQLLDLLASDKLSMLQRKEHCNSLHSIGGSLMYATLCRNILSDIQEHRRVADKDGPKYRQNSPLEASVNKQDEVPWLLHSVRWESGGLLHSIPAHEDEKDVVEKMTEALRECVVEKEPGGRVKAVNNLADMLALYVKLH